jgi:hypothetical protein
MLDSNQQSTFMEFEPVAVDDGGSDASAEIVRGMPGKTNASPAATRPIGRGRCHEQRTGRSR